MSTRAWNFGWHNVLPTWCFPGSEKAAAARFRRQLLWLARTTNVLSIEDVVARWRRGDPLPPRTTTISFDDGYTDNLAVAVPVLEELGLPATFFLVPGILSGHVRPWWESVSRALATTAQSELVWDGRRWPLGDGAQRRRAVVAVRASLKRVDQHGRDARVAELLDRLDVAERRGRDELFLDWAGAREIVSRGFTVGSHTMLHAILSQESAEEQERDLRCSRALLQDRLQVDAALFAYPNGTSADFDATSRAAAVAVGHLAAMTTVPGPASAGSDPYQLHRYVMSPDRGLLAFARVGRHPREAAVSRRSVANPISPR